MYINTGLGSLPFYPVVAAVEADSCVSSGFYRKDVTGKASLSALSAVDDFGVSTGFLAVAVLYNIH